MEFEYRIDRVEEGAGYVSGDWEPIAFQVGEDGLFVLLRRWRGSELATSGNRIQNGQQRNDNGLSHQ
jgi:hypothetical protein